MHRLDRLNRELSRWLLAHPVLAVFVTAVFVLMLAGSVPTSLRAEVATAQPWVSWVALGLMAWSLISLMVLPRALRHTPSEAIVVLWTTCLAVALIGFGAGWMGAWSWVAGAGFVGSVAAMTFVTRWATRSMPGTQPLRD